MNRAPYACCKHGPCHRMAECGFAHELKEVAMPRNVSKKLWLDTTENVGGHAGIDMFFGQEYTSFQLERIMTLYVNESFADLPAWVRQLVWFLGLRSDDHFVCDGDFGWSERTEYLESRPSADEGYPFPIATDPWGRTLAMRMLNRNLTRVDVKVYEAIYDWDPSGFAEQTPMRWGAHSRQYLCLSASKSYVRICDSNCATPWWYVVSLEDVSFYLTKGGWAPPLFMMHMGAPDLSLHEVVYPTSCFQAEEYSGSVPVPIASGDHVCEVFTDGSTACYHGIAAAWIFGSACNSGIVSIAGNFIGSESAELLGIAGALIHAILYAGRFRQYIFRVDSMNAISHVFQEGCVGNDGRHLLPAIRFCIALRERLANLDVDVQCIWISGRSNPAHVIAIEEQRRRSRLSWSKLTDKLPAYFTPSYKQIFLDILTPSKMRSLSVAVSTMINNLVPLDRSALGRIQLLT